MYVKYKQKICDVYAIDYKFMKNMSPILEFNFVGEIYMRLYAL